jgi:hypothetical protein
MGVIEKLWRCVFMALGVIALAVGYPAFANEWGVFSGMAEREWRTDGEPRPRISLFSWDASGRVLVGKHGFESRRESNASDFADTTQRLSLDPKTGTIEVTYEYADGRAPLRAVIRVTADGTATESFTDANGIEKRNIYTLPSASVTMIERQEFRDGRWIALGQTRKLGMTPAEIADKKLREEQARRLAAAQAAAQKAEEQAFKERMIALEQAEREEEQARQASQPNALQVLQGMAQQINQQNRDNQARFERQMAADIAEQKRQEAERLRREAEEQSRRVAEANARQEAIARQYEAQRSANDVQRGQQASAEAERRAAEQRRQAQAQAEAEADERRAAAEAERQKREALAEAEAERRRQAEQARLAELRRKEEEARRPVAFKEGVVVCEKKRDNYYRCEGPLQITYSDLVTPAGLTSLREACGGGTSRDLGMSGGFRVFGCGFGIHPTIRDYPGNRDVPAEYGLYISGRGTFYCPRSTTAYCRGK